MRLGILEEHFYFLLSLEKYRSESFRGVKPYVVEGKQERKLLPQNFYWTM
jgi:hypothetical protein